MATAFEITIDAQCPAKLAAFWAAVLSGYAIRHYDDVELARLQTIGLDPDTDPSVPIDGPGPTFWFQQVESVCLNRNRLHLDIKVANLEAERERLEGLGAMHRDDAVDHVVMLDPEGNQFCLFRDVCLGQPVSDHGYQGISLPSQSR